MSDPKPVAEPAEQLPGASHQRGEAPRSHLAHVLREFVIVVVLALVLSLVVKTWLMQAFYIPSGSMEDTLVQGDRVVVSKLTPTPFALERGDIVVFEDPGQWLPASTADPLTGVRKNLHDGLVFVGLLPSDADNHLIKRVIGLPGDHVVCCTKDGKLTVNGVAVTEPYLKSGDAPSNDPFDITVPAGKVWVMGDHRSNSGDSRYHDDNSGGADGSVAIDRVVGRAVAVVWPFTDLAWLGQQADTTFAKVPEPSS